MNELERHQRVFDGIEPFAGEVPQGFYPDWTGALTDSRFRAYLGMKRDDVGGGHIATHLPTPADGEGWFEAVNWVEAAREARDRFVMVTLGACYGAQAVGSYRVLQMLNPIPCTLVAVEPEPENLVWIADHFRDNGIDPDDHWLLGMAIGASNDLALFPVGAPGSGAQNALSTNRQQSRELYLRALTASGARAKAALRSLLLEGTTGLRRNLLTGDERDQQAGLSGNLRFSLETLKRRLAQSLRGRGPASPPDGSDDGFFDAEIKLVSQVTLKDVLGPFSRVDYLEADIQQSEIVVFPPFMDLLKRKVRRIHIGTHGRDVHLALLEQFQENGWDVVFNFEPNSEFATDNGTVPLNDGILTVLNPALRS